MTRKGSITIRKNFLGDIDITASGFGNKGELTIDENALDDLLVAIHDYKIEQAVEKLRDEVDEGISNLTIGRR